MIDVIFLQTKSFFFFFIVCEKWNFFLCVCNPLYALLDQLFSWMIVLVASGFDEWIQLCCGVLGWVLASLDGKSYLVSSQVTLDPIILNLKWDG